MSKTKISTVRLPISAAMEVSVRHQGREDPIKIAIKHLACYQLEAIGAPSDTLLDVQVREHMPHRFLLEGDVCYAVCEDAVVLDTEDDPDADDEVDP